MPNVPNRDRLPAVLDQIDELRRQAADLLAEARDLAEAADAVIALATELIQDGARRDVTGDEFEASGIFPLMAMLRDIGSTLAAAGT